MCMFFDSFTLFGSAVLSYVVKNRTYFHRRISTFVRAKKKKYVNISALPEECLLPIFDCVPLSELLRLDQVCLKWAMLLPSATLRRRSLVLNLRGAPNRFAVYAIPMNDSQEMSMEGGRAHRPLSYRERENTLNLPFLVANSFDEYILDPYAFEGFLNILYDDSLGSGDGEVISEMGRLRQAALDGQLIDYFRYLFPNLEHLVVIHPYCPFGDLQLLIGLVRAWSLISLKLWIRTFRIEESYGYRPEKHPIGTLLLSINNSQQPSLRELTLDVTGNEPDEYAFPMESFAFIGQLQVVKLFLGKFDRTNAIWNILHRYGSTNNNLRQISLATAHPVQVEALNPQFAYTSKVAHLFMLTPFESDTELRQICLRFTALTNVQVCLSFDISFGELVAKLQSLTQMTTLKLIIYSENLFGEDAFDLELEDGEQARVLSLPQVNTLEIVISKNTHHDLDSFPPLVFPSVELIILANVCSLEEPEKACVLCQPPNITGEPSHEKAFECKRLLAYSLRNKFPNKGVRMYVDGTCLTVTDTRLEACKTLATLFTVFVGLPFLFEKILISI